MEVISDNRRAISYVSPGKYLRFPALFERQLPLIVCPVDDFLIFGPRNGLEQPDAKIQQIARARPDAMVTFAGTVMRFPNHFRDTRIILNLTASTVRSKHTKKVRIHSIDTALKLNASAVAAHINLCSQYSSEMIEIAARIISEAHQHDIPTVGIIYPRAERGEQDDNMQDLKEQNNAEFAQIVAHCVALGVNLGFDAIKTFYTDNTETFRGVIEASSGVPVIIAGGPLDDEQRVIERATEAIAGGAAGISFGRNVFGREDPAGFLQRLRKAISI